MGLADSFICHANYEDSFICHAGFICHANYGEKRRKGEVFRRACRGRVGGEAMSTDADGIGIDLGTTQSLVRVVDAGFPISLAEGGRR